MKSIRRGVFETNSSSTHSITLCSKEDYAAWKKGRMFLDISAGKIITREEAMKEIKDLNVDIADKEEIEDYLRDCEIYTYKDYNGDEYEYFEEDFTTKSGDKVIAFGRYSCG